MASIKAQLDRINAEHVCDTRHWVVWLTGLQGDTALDTRTAELDEKLRRQFEGERAQFATVSIL